MMRSMESVHASRMDFAIMYVEKSVCAKLLFASSNKKKSIELARARDREKRSEQKKLKY